MREEFIWVGLSLGSQSFCGDAVHAAPRSAHPIVISPASPSRAVAPPRHDFHARDTENRMCTGFNATEPGTGHLNAYGHQVLANLIWNTLSAKP